MLLGMAKKITSCYESKVLFFSEDGKKILNGVWILLFRHLDFSFYCIAGKNERKFYLKMLHTNAHSTLNKFNFSFSQINKDFIKLKIEKFTFKCHLDIEYIDGHSWESIEMYKCY